MTKKGEDSTQQPADPAAPSDGPQVSFKLVYGKQVDEIQLPEAATIADLKTKAYELHSIPAEMQVGCLVFEGPELTGSMLPSQTATRLSTALVVFGGM